MKNSRMLAALIVLSFAISSCSPYYWKTFGKDKVYKNSSLGYSFNVPAGWMKSESAKNPLIISYDGPYLQRITISVLAPKEKIKFAFTKRTITENMLPEELAEIYEDDLKLNSNFTNYEKVELLPRTISGIDGFELKFKFKRKETSVDYTGTFYGFQVGKYSYFIEHTAISGYYFDTHLKEVEDFVNGFVIDESIFKQTK